MTESPRNRRIFLDYASTTPVEAEVVRAMEPFLSGRFENPAALYAEGVKAKEALAAARMSAARTIQCRADEVYFTGSGTESDNMAILGVARRAKEWGIAKPHVVTTTIEHPAVLEACRQLEREGCEVTYVAVGEEGIVRVQDVAAAIKENTVLVSVMLANNEMGTIQPVRAISNEVKEARAKREAKSGEILPYPYLHTDASQAANYLDVTVAHHGADLMTLDASKIYGPKGVGCLFVRRGVEVAPIMFGGGQERGLRPATENLAGIVGFAKALEVAAAMRASESARLTGLRDGFIDELLKRIPSATLNGSRTERLPNNINICVPGLDGEMAVIKLDARGVACSSASSCRALTDETYSYVIEALGKSECASSSLRFTLGRTTTKDELGLALESVVEVAG